MVVEAMWICRSLFILTNGKAKAREKFFRFGTEEKAIKMHGGY